MRSTKNEIKKHEAEYLEQIAQAPRCEGIQFTRTTLGQIFNSVAMDVVDYTWFLLDDLWSWGNPDGKGGDEIRARSIFSNEIQITDTDVLLRYASAAGNDWCTFYGVDAPPGIESFAAEIYKKTYENPSALERIDFHVNSIDICLFNVDGAYWSVFCKDEALLDRLRRRFPDSMPTQLTDLLFCI